MRVSRELVACMHQTYQRVGTLAETAKLYGRSIGTVRWLFVRDGLPLKSLAEVGQRRARQRMARNDELVQRMYADYQSGLTLQEVAQKYGRHECTSVHSLFKVRGLKCRQGPGATGRAKGAARHRSHLDAKAAEMWAVYQETNSCAAVARRFASDKATVKYVLQRNGYMVRTIRIVPRQANGAPQRYVPKTDAELDAIIARMTRIVVPPQLKFEWRQWSLERRAAFVARVRARLKLPDERPDAPFSANVEPFEYGHRRAHAILEQLNRGRTSRTKVTQLKPCSQGVIWGGRLWTWAKKVGYINGPFVPGRGRACLHWAVWEKHHGRRVPRGFGVRHVDGNRNNFDPANLVLVSRADLARENIEAWRVKKSRELTALLLARAQRNESDENSDTIHHLRATG